ncbi:kinase-like protein [Gymnopus androsaceus JB14]|uniref:Kinase-like protein n=1 Tax=Gymnopus androsaceus JB14 TaxID=1447944 RepID=A0A6A4GX73_9AGAR|nr:kinase-like protein [Gymnopus androsaceus JB14]
MQIREREFSRYIQTSNFTACWLKNWHQNFCHETLIWRQLRHPNILPLLGVNQTTFAPAFCFIAPWMDNGDVITYLKKNPSHSRLAVLLDIAAGLVYLHSKDPPIIHGDIRGANVLVTDDLHCCIADFGLATCKPNVPFPALLDSDMSIYDTHPLSKVRSSIRWMAPERFNVKEVVIVNEHPSSDIYSFGCSIIEILTLQHPFHDKKSDAAVLFGILNGERPWRLENIWCPDSIWDLATQCWALDPKARPTAREVYEALKQPVLELPPSGSGVQVQSLQI